MPVILGPDRKTPDKSWALPRLLLLESVEVCIIARNKEEPGFSWLGTVSSFSTGVRDCLYVSGSMPWHYTMQTPA